MHTTIQFNVPKNELYTVLEKGLSYLTDMASPKDSIKPEMSQSEVMAQMLMGLFASDNSQGRTNQTVEDIKKELEAGHPNANRYLDNVYGRAEKVYLSVDTISDEEYQVGFRAIHLRAEREELHQDLEQILGYKGMVTE